MKDQSYQEAIDQIYEGAEKLKGLFDASYGDEKKEATVCALNCAIAVWMQTRGRDGRQAVSTAELFIRALKGDNENTEGQEQEAPEKETELTE